MNKIYLLAGIFTVFIVRAEIVQEKFTNNPAANGWQIYGDTDLFQWDSIKEVLNVTWDSSQTNTYFYHPLGTAWTKTNSFCIVFDLNLTDVAAVGYFELAIGLCNFADSTSTDFSRANGYSPNLLEFDYFPDGPDSYGPSIDATLIDTNDAFYFAYETNAMPTNVTYHVVLIHRAGESAISGLVFTNNEIFTRLPHAASYGANDFRVDTLAICNYTTTDDIYGNSLLAHGTVDNLAFASPLPVDVIENISAGKVQFAATTNWIYLLQHTADFQTWTNVATATLENPATLILQDTNLPADKAFYRVNADLP